MKLSQILLTVVLSIAAAYAVVTFSGKQAGTAPQKETAYERVMKTGTLRVGYLIYPPFFERDITTGKFLGIYYDLFEEIGRQLNLKIEWAEEVSTSTGLEGLKTGRYEAVAAPYMPTPGRARAGEFTTPNSFIPYYAYVRNDDTRFDNDLQKINDPAVKVVVLEGELSQTVKEQDFPKAGLLSLPSLTDISQVLLQVEMNKADVGMTEPATAERYLQKNPGKLRRLATPLRMQPISIALPVGEASLKSLINTTIETLLGTGFIERLYKKYTTAPGQFFAPSQPWRPEEIKP